MSDPFLTAPNDDRNRTIMYIVYGLFGLAILFGGLPAIAGVIVAYVKRDDMIGTYYHDHLIFLIRTFWASLIFTVVGVMLAFFVIGIPILWAIGIWYLFRVVYGFVKLMDNKTVTTTGWFA